VPLLGKYLPAEQDDSDEGANAGTTPSNEFDEIETALRVAAPVQRTPGRTPTKKMLRTAAKVPVEEPSGGGGGGGPGDSGGGGGTQPGTEGAGDGEGKSKGPGAGEPMRMIRLSDIRFRAFAKADQYVLVLEGKRNVSGYIDLQAVGEGNRFSVAVASAKDGASGSELRTAGSMIMDVAVEKGKPLRLLVKLRSTLPCTLSVRS